MFDFCDIYMKIEVSRHLTHSLNEMKTNIGDEELIHFLETHMYYEIVN